MPTDMRALQDFDEPDKLKIHANDIITIIEGRWACILEFFEGIWGRILEFRVF